MTRPTPMIGMDVNEISKRNCGELDLINILPNDILSSIISSLSIDQVVRSSILSKRWKHVWKYASHLDFNWRRMIKLSSIPATEEDARRYGELVQSMLNHHHGGLTSCSFKHLPQSLALGDMERWISCAKEKNKRLNSLSLECGSSFLRLEALDLKPNFQPRAFSILCSLELTNYVVEDSILSAFESCANLKILKLKKMVINNKTINEILKKCFNLEKFSFIQSSGFDMLKIQNPSLKFLELKWMIVEEINVNVEDLQVILIDSLICPAKGLKIYSQSLRTFSSSYNPIVDNIFSRKSSLKTHDILENCSDLFESQTTNVFLNLLTLSIELDLNNIREALALSYILKSCIYLNTLEITIPIEEASDSSVIYEDCALPFPKSMFWERQKMYNCINHKLKFVTMRGFTGKEQEVKFLKHLITRAYVIKKINVICDSTFADKAKDLLSLPRASTYLSIIVKSKHHIQFM